MIRAAKCRVQLQSNAIGLVVNMREDSSTPNTGESNEKDSWRMKRKPNLHRGHNPKGPST